MTFQKAQNYARVLQDFEFKTLVTINNGSSLVSTSIEDVNVFSDGVPAYLPTIVTSLDSSYIGTSPWFALNWQGAIRDPKHILDLSEVKLAYDEKEAQNFIDTYGGYPLLGLIPIGPIPVTASNIDTINGLLRANLLSFLGKDKSFLYVSSITTTASSNYTFTPPYTFSIPAPTPNPPQLLTVATFGPAFAWFNASNPLSQGVNASSSEWGIGKGWALFLDDIQPTEAYFTNCAQGKGWGMEVFSQDVLNSVLWNGYCSQSMEEAGYGAGDLVPVTFNAIGSGCGVSELYQPLPQLGITSTTNPNQWCATVGTINEAGNSYAWTAGTTYDSIPKNYISYDFWSQGGDLIQSMAEAGLLLIWNKTIKEPSVKISDLIPQSKAWSSNGQTVSLPVLPSASTASTTKAAAPAVK